MTAKANRRRMIGDWLRSERIASQEELVARLDAAGIAATQATVSRDLDELGAVKLRRDGRIAYALPGQVEAGHAAAMLDRLLAEWVSEIVPAAGLVVLRTPPGSANLVANALDAAALEGIVGTIAGDDTIFIAVADGSRPHDIAARLRRRRAGEAAFAADVRSMA